MQIATWNVNSLKVRIDQVLAWLKKTDCDVLALQELKMNNENFPKEVFSSLGYYCVFNGQKTYNGVAIISKFPISEVVYDIPEYSDIQKRVISATIKGIRIICVYIVNGQTVMSDKYTYKLIWLKELHNFISNELQKYSQLIVLGDFNIAPQDIDVYDPITWQGQVICTPAERLAYTNLCNLGLIDSFRQVNLNSGEYTWWDYRNFAFRRKLGLRIDHILVSQNLSSVIQECYIDKDPRKDERPSDHAPVILNLNINI